MESRQEAKKQYVLADGRIITVVLRSGITPEDVLINGAKCKAYAVRTGRVNDWKHVPRAVKDYLIKTNISI